MNQIFIDEFIKELNANISNNYQTVEYAFENEYRWPEVRNAFSHADPQKTFKGISVPATKFTTSDLHNPEEFLKRVFEDKPNTHLSAENNIIIQGITQSIKAKQEAVPYFLTIDGIVRNLCTKLFKTRMNRS